MLTKFYCHFDHFISEIKVIVNSHYVEKKPNKLFLESRVIYKATLMIFFWFTEFFHSNVGPEDGENRLQFFPYSL